VFAQINATTIRGYDKASYNSSETGKFMKSWLIAGPVFVSEDSLNPDLPIQEKVFKENVLSSVKIVNGQPAAPLQIKKNILQWKMFSSGEDAVMLDKVFDEKERDYVYAYALAEIKAQKPEIVTLGIGSDDGIKIWLNGKLVHENWVPRGVNKDDDIIPLQLVKGSNQILLKVQDM